MTMRNLQLHRPDLNAPKHDFIHSTNHFRTNTYFFSFVIFLLLFIVLSAKKDTAGKGYPNNCRVMPIAQSGWQGKEGQAGAGIGMRGTKSIWTEEGERSKREPVVIKVRLPVWCMEASLACD